MRKLSKLLLDKKPDALGLRAPSDETFLLGTAAQGVTVRAITPVLGGGVESFVPDTVDVVRVPSIRGAIRWWWRALQPQLSLDELRAAERRVWGGVGRNADEASTASPVRIDVRVTNKGQVVPAGMHPPAEIRPGEPPPTTPRPPKPSVGWTGGKPLGYGLFPLQRSAPERNAWQSPAAMPTKDQRIDLEFELRIRVLARGAATLNEQERALVLNAAKLWLTFGGYGARTRRGFGALQCDAVPFLEALGVLRGVVGEAPDERPSLASVKLFVGADAMNAQAAHRDALEALQTFRQGKSIGRDPGNGTPGRSRWPEPDSLRRLVGGNFGHHNPFPAHRSPSAPRAEFGLPIVVKFKGPPDDQADATIAATNSNGGGRWASPLLLRPVWDGVAYVPMALVLAGHRPTHAWVVRGDQCSQVPVAYDDATHGGARGDVRDALIQSRGHALEAFASWLVASRGFRRVGGPR